MDNFLVSDNRRRVLQSYWSHWMGHKTVAAEALFWIELEADLKGRKFGEEIERAQYRKLVK